MFEMPDYAQAYLESMGLSGNALFPNNPAVNLFAQNMAPSQPQTAMPAFEPQLQQNPALSNFVSQQQAMAGEENAQPQGNPIATGVDMARKSPLKERIAATKEQERAALRHAIGAFAQGYAHTHSPSTLYNLASNINPALAAYEQQVAGAQASNLEMMKLENELEKAQFERQKQTKELENATMKAEAYSKYMNKRAENKPMTEGERRQQQNLIKNTITHVNKFRQQDLKDAKKELDEMRVNGIHVRALPADQRKLVEEQFWSEKNTSYNNAIAPYLDILKKNHAMGMDVIGIDFKTGKKIIDKNYQPEEEEILSPDEEEIPASFMKENKAPPAKTPNFPDFSKMTDEQYAAWKKSQGL